MTAIELDLSLPERTSWVTREPMTNGACKVLLENCDHLISLYSNKMAQDEMNETQDVNEVAQDGMDQSGTGQIQTVQPEDAAADEVAQDEMDPRNSSGLNSEVFDGSSAQGQNAIQNQTEPGSSSDSNAEVFDQSAAIALQGQTFDFEMTPGSKLNSTLFYCKVDKQLFKKNKKNAKGEMGYTCISNGCPARVYKRANEQCYFSYAYTGHKHENAESLKEKYALKNQIKVACQSLEEGEFGSTVATVSEIFTAKTAGYVA